MVMNLVLTGPTVCERGDVCVVSIHQHTHLLLFNERWEQLFRPECLRLLTRPRIVGIAIKSMDENEVSIGVARRVHFC